jgi:AcrR family transcriptional regulator
MRAEKLSRDEIVAAAIHLLDAQGLEGLNMRALGERLGSAATAVYWHFASKDDLVAFTANAVWSEIALPDLARVDWRTAATAMASDLHAVLTRHPWLLQAFGSLVVYGPGKARYDERALAVYEAAGFCGARADQAATTVFTYVLGNALGPAAAAALSRKVSRAGGSAEERLRASMAKAKEIATAYPRLRDRLHASGAEYAAAPEKSFEFGLAAILDGLEAHLAAGRGPAAKGGHP